ncbi:MAG: hypothetical protein IJH52_00815 [Oscillospiraceae bacterium]|nr:hypothetical protein [Oscillospiraceae bacterium]
MGMNRYNAATGRREYLPEQEGIPPKAEKPPRREVRRGGNNIDLSAIFNRLSPQRLEQEDLILMLILFLLWRESGETELLIALGAFLLL